MDIDPRNSRNKSKTLTTTKAGSLLSNLLDEKIDNSGSDEEIPPPKGLLVSTPQKKQKSKIPKKYSKGYFKSLR